MYIQCMFEYILSSVVLITAKSCICEIKKHVTYEMLICVVGSRFNIMNKQPSFFIKKWKYIQWMYIFCCYQQSHLWVEKNNLIKCFVFPSRNLFMLLVYLHPAHIDVQCYRVGFQLVYLIQWQVRIMKKKSGAQVLWQNLLPSRYWILYKIFGIAMDNLKSCLQQ